MINLILNLFLFSLMLSTSNANHISLKNLSSTNNNYKSMHFKYSINENEFLKSGNGSLVIGPNNYRLDLDNFSFNSNKTVSKRYDKETNQIFIENSIPKIDSIFLMFLNKDFINNLYYNKNNNLFIDLGFNNLFANLHLDSSLDSIISIQIYNEKLKFTVSEIIFKSDSVMNLDKFKISSKDAFILDLRY